MYTNRISTVTHPFEAFIVPPVAENLASLDDTNRCDYGLGGIRGFTTVDVDGRYFTVSLYVQDTAEPVFTRSFPRRPVLRSAAVSPGQFQFFLEGEAGHSYCIERSADGREWAPWSTNTLFSAEGLVITDTLDAGAAQCLYRSEWAP